MPPHIDWTCASCSGPLAEVSVWRSRGVHEVDFSIEICCSNEDCAAFDVAVE